MALEQRVRPLINVLNVVRNNLELAALFVGRLNTNIVFSVCPINADEGCESIVRVYVRGSSPNSGKLAIRDMRARALRRQYR